MPLVLLAADSPIWNWMPVTPAQFSLGLLAAIFALMVFTNVSTDLVLIGGVVVLLATGVLLPHEALAGLANEGVVTVGVLFIIGAAVQETGGVDWIAKSLFGRPKSVLGAIVRLVFPTLSLSAFLNNTPLVAMLIPAVSDYARAHRISPSKLMIPLSYAAIMGGTCTLIGTSTNIVVQGLLIKATNKGLGLFDISWVGVPCAILGGLYIVFAARFLLADRKPAVSSQDDPREYTVEMQVEADSPLAGKSIEAAGLRHLPGLFVAEIDRDGVAMPAVSPQEILRAGDRLLFVGAVESVKELQRIRGLIPATDDVFKLKTPRPQRCLIEAVVSNTCPLLGLTIRESRFRSHYNAVVVAVARNGERLHQKIGDIELHAGDVVLVEAHPSFADQMRNSRDFFLISRVEESTPPKHELALLAVGILVGMILLVSLRDIVEALAPYLPGLPSIVPWVPQMSMLLAALIAALLMLLTRCVSVESARKSLEWPVLLAIAASFAFGTALEKTGAAKQLADSAVSLAGGSPWITLAIIYLCTMLLTELITNNAAAALMFPFAMKMAEQLGVSYLPFVVAVMMAASHGYATPIGYQTNLMVYGPGGYKFSDYLKIGVPLDLLMAAICIALTPLVFPFSATP
jgi:di/tricarboxylate transporter